MTRTRKNTYALIIATVLAACLFPWAPSRAMANAGESQEPIQLGEDPRSEANIEVLEKQVGEDIDPLELIEDPCVEQVPPPHQSVVSPEGFLSHTDVAVAIPRLSASAHVQKRGWLKASKTDAGILLGTTGDSLRLEAFRIQRPDSTLTGGIAYSAHVQGIGWQKARKNGGVAGTEGKQRRLEAVTLKLTGGLARTYDIWYRAHVQGIGWMAWTQNGNKAGTEGLSLRIEAIEVALCSKEESGPTANGSSMDVPYIKKPKLTYCVMTGSSWQGWRRSGKTAGKAHGPAIRSILASLAPSSHMRLVCSAHLSGVGWTSYARSDTQVGSARSRMEAVRMRLRGKAAKLASVWYRAYVDGVGWTMWAHDGQAAGSVGRGIAITAIQAKVVARHQDSPTDGELSLPYTCITKKAPQLLRDADQSQLKLVRAAKATPWPGPGLCAGWVQSVYQNAGRASFVGNANDLYNAYCKSSRLADLRVGMIVGVRTHTRTTAGRTWGHVGLYIGNGWVMHSVTEKVKKVPLTWWIDYYGTTVTPKWGWPTH